MRGVLFDLDGTLVHTLRDLGGAMNKALEEHNLPGHPTDAYARMIGGGMAKLVERASGGEGEQELLQARLLVHYQHQMVTHTRPYPGIWPVLDELRARGVPCGVVSNKDHKMTVGVVARVFPDGPFSAVRGRQDGVPRKPSPRESGLHARPGRLAGPVCLCGRYECRPGSSCSRRNAICGGRMGLCGN